MDSECRGESQSVRKNYSLLHGLDEMTSFAVLALKKQKALIMIQSHPALYNVASCISENVIVAKFTFLEFFFL